MQNPTAQQFMQATQANQVQHSSKPVSQSNVRGAKHHMELDNAYTPVPKRRRMKQSKKHTRQTYYSKKLFFYTCMWIVSPHLLRVSFSVIFLRKLFFCDVYCSIQPLAWSTCPQYPLTGYRKESASKWLRLSNIHITANLVGMVVWNVTVYIVILFVKEILQNLQVCIA